MTHDGPLAAGNRHRFPTRPSVPQRFERSGVQSSDRATADTLPVVVAPVRSGAGVPGRRTITITGYAAERPIAHTRPESQRRYVSPRRRDGVRPDRYAALAVALALLLVFVAATSAHGATPHIAAGVHAVILHVGAADGHWAVPHAAATTHAAVLHAAAAKAQAASLHATRLR